jgi:hypothetical protein
MPKRTPARHDRPERPPASALAPLAPRVAADIAGNLPASDDLITQFIDSSDLAETVPLLQPETLHLLVRHRGLEACTVLLAAATARQLNAVLDIDLWQPARAGEDEQLDVARFGEWVETLCAAGAQTAAAVVTAMDVDVVAGALSAYVKVIDSATLAPSSDERDWIDVASLGDLTLELGGYVVAARTGDAWDAIVSLLVALDEHQPRRFHAVMRGCRQLSSSIPEIDGLDVLLMARDQLLHDVAAGRLHRRSNKGYVAPADARAFLQLARERGGVRRGATSEVNPVAASYLTSADEEEPAPQEAVTSRRGAAPQAARARAERIEAAAAALAAADAAAERPRALTTGTSPHPPRLELVHALLEAAGAADDLTFATRERELAFLANALLSGSSVLGRGLTSQEASEAVLATCNLGLEGWRGTPSEGSRDRRNVHVPDQADWDLVRAFERGWAVLHEQVSMFVAEQLIATLASTHSYDQQIQDDLQALRRDLERHCRNGTPSKAGESLEVLAILDQPIWISLLGVLSECPVVPAALSATVERRTGAISPTAFEFISTSRQVRQVHAFMHRLGELLVR